MRSHKPARGERTQAVSSPRECTLRVLTQRFLCSRYMMVDSADDQKTHRPAPPKEVRAVVPAHQQFECPLATRLKKQAASPKSQGAGQRQECSQSPPVSKGEMSFATVLQGLSAAAIPDSHGSCSVPSDSFLPSLGQDSQHKGWVEQPTPAFLHPLPTAQLCFCLSSPCP